MADDDNTATELPTPAEENSGGDIEQGRPSSSSSWVAAPITGGGTSTPTPSTTSTWPLGGLEHVDVEEAAPVPLPLIQQLADMDMDMAELIEKDNTNANIHTNVGPSEDASMTPQPPKQGAMEQIEDGDDGAAPRPLNYAEFEDESEPKLDLGEESVVEDDGPPLPFQQRDSLSDAKEIGPEPESHSASDNEGARQVASSSSAAERYPSVPILEAYLVEEEEEGPPTAVVTPPPTPSVPVVTPGGHDTVYEATPLEPELPWWKQRRTKVFMVINFVLVLIAALAVGVDSRSRRHLRNQKSDWAFCTDSSECKSQCCSNKYSTSDGRFKCTPVGDFKPEEDNFFKPEEGCPKWSEWRCFGRNYEGNVKIWWGHTVKDAEWACNNWKETCGKSGCSASEVRVLLPWRGD